MTYDRDAAMQRIGDASGLHLATPIASTQDGPRMSGNLSNFGGKKAAPFGKGGKRRAKVLAAKSAVRGKKWTPASDAAYDKSHGIKEGSAKDKALDKKRGVKDMSRRGSGDVTLSKLSTAERNALPPSAFVFPGKREYPIHDRGHAIDALARSQGKPEAAAVKAAVYKRYPDLRKG